MGQDEAHARSVLAEMQERLVHGPHAALGIPQTANAAEIRTAFLQLTKTYHPARFGRLSVETQKLSNEVFLGLRAAHDSLARPQRPASTGRIPLARQTGATPPLLRPPAPVATAVIPTVQVTTAPVPAARPGPRPQSTPQTPPNPMQRTVPIKPITTTPRPSAPANGLRAMQKPIDGEAGVVELLQRGQWDAANAAIEQTLAKQPDSVRFRALHAYAKGRKAQLAGQRDEARVELEQALQLDPALQLAKTALGELFTRRK